MNYKKKTLAFLVALPISLGGCNPKDLKLNELPLVGNLFGGKPVRNVNLTVWGLWNAEDTIRPLIEKYTAENPNITVSYEDRSVMVLVDYKERVFTRAFEEGSKPDVVMAHASWLPRLISEGATWAAPSGYFDTAYIDSNFYPVVKEVGMSGSSIHSLPSTYDGLVLVYNKRHFEEAGITTPPADWENFRRDAIALTKPDTSTERLDDIIRGGAAIGMADNIDHFSDIYGLMLVQAGVRIPEELDTEQAADALTFYTNFVKEDHVWDATMPESVLAFSLGKVSMILVPTWRVYELLEHMPDPSVIGVARVPQAREDTPLSWATYWTWVVPKSSPNPDESWSFIKYLVDSAQQEALSIEESRHRPYGSIHSNTTLSLNQTRVDYLKPAIDDATISHTAEIAARAGNRRQVEALRVAVSEVLAGKTAAEALSTAKTTIAPKNN